MVPFVLHVFYAVTKFLDFKIFRKKGIYRDRNKNISILICFWIRWFFQKKTGNRNKTIFIVLTFFLKKKRKLKIPEKSEFRRKFRVVSRDVAHKKIGETWEGGPEQKIHEDIFHLQTPLGKSVMSAHGGARRHTEAHELHPLVRAGTWRSTGYKKNVTLIQREIQMTSDKRRPRETQTSCVHVPTFSVHIATTCVHTPIFSVHIATIWSRVRTHPYIFRTYRDHWIQITHGKFSMFWEISGHEILGNGERRLELRVADFCRCPTRSRQVRYSTSVHSPTHIIHNATRIYKSFGTRRASGYNKNVMLVHIAIQMQHTSVLPKM